MSPPAIRQQRAAAIRLGLTSLATWPLRRWLAAAVVSVAAALAMGVPTGIIKTSVYTRMTAVTWWDYPVWALSAILIGLTAATYLRVGGPGAQPAPASRSTRTVGATVLSTFAVGCPICNKLVVGLIGVSGALSYWAPLQPVLGVMSIGLLAAGLAVRLRGSVSCPAPLAS